MTTDKLTADYRLPYLTSIFVDARQLPTCVVRMRDGREAWKDRKSTSAIKDEAMKRSSAQHSPRFSDDEVEIS